MTEPIEPRLRLQKLRFSLVPNESCRWSYHAWNTIYRRQLCLNQHAKLEQNNDRRRNFQFINS